ncbi:MAG: hypothetical protein AAGB13_18205 [Cyanobacteria bacterium P01_F01_bin.33]
MIDSETSGAMLLEGFVKVGLLLRSVRKGATAFGLAVRDCRRVSVIHRWQSRDVQRHLISVEISVERSLQARSGTSG